MTPRSVVSQVLWLLVVGAIAVCSAWAGVHFGQRQSQLESLDAKLQSLERLLMKGTCSDYKCPVGMALKSDKLSSSLMTWENCCEAHNSQAKLQASSESQRHRETELLPGLTTNSSCEDEGTCGAENQHSAQAAITSVGTPDDSEYPDLACEATRDWMDVKALIWSAFGSWQAGVAPIAQADLDQVLDEAAARLEELMHKPDTCGMGRLCMTLLTMAQTQQLQLHSLPSIHSPILTILLDVPWRIVMRSGWPIFALLAQLSLRQPQGADVPVTGGLILDYFTSLHAGLLKEKADALAGLGAQYIQTAESSADGLQSSPMHVMPALCALAAQLLGSGALEPEHSEATLQHMQSFFRQQVSSISDLQGTIDSAWPLHAVLHAAAVNLMRQNHPT